MCMCMCKGFAFGVDLKVYVNDCLRGGGGLFSSFVLR